MKKITRLVAAPLCALALVGSLAACDENATASVPDNFFGYLVGNGTFHSNGPQGNRTVNRLLPPGSISEYNDNYDNAMYFPAAKRNYIIAKDGGDTDAPVRGRTGGLPDAPGTPVIGYLSVYWQPNTNTTAPGGDPLRDSPAAQFISFCAGKYHCSVGAPEDFAVANGQPRPNASTPGWNDMLRENMWPVLNRLFERSSRKVSDNVWVDNDVDAKRVIAEDMMAGFSAEMQKNTGATVDLFCGSGSTGSGDSFDCQGIRIVVDRVFAESTDLQQQSDKAAQDKRQLGIDSVQAPELKRVTDDLYGPFGPQVRACEHLPSATCVFGPAGVVVNK